MDITILGAHNTESENTRLICLLIDDVLAIDATVECWDRFLANAGSFRERKRGRGEMSLNAFLGIALRHRIAAMGLRYYLLVSAVKP